MTSIKKTLSSILRKIQGKPSEELFNPGPGCRYEPPPGEPTKVCPACIGFFSPDLENCPYCGYPGVPGVRRI